MCILAAVNHGPLRGWRARAELKQHNGVQFYLGLLSTSYWQESALDALLVWLNDEPTHVERYMKTAFGISQLAVIIEAKGNAAFVTMLDALSAGNDLSALRTELQEFAA